MIPGDAPRAIDAYVAARLLPGLRPVTVRKWAQRGQLERRGADAEGRTLYRLADLERLWCASRVGQLT
jgi:DNA-binding transcriptional MerR regulator